MHHIYRALPRNSISHHHRAFINYSYARMASHHSTAHIKPYYNNPADSVCAQFATMLLNNKRASSSKY